MTSSYSLNDAELALETYGTNFDLWPDQGLVAFAKNNSALNTALREAEMLDQRLTTHKVPTASDLLETRILKLAAQTSQDIPAQDSSVQNTHVNPTSQYGWMRIAALFLVSAIIGGSFYIQTINEPSELVQSTAIDAETDAWLEAANDMDMVDVFLWVETEGLAG
ncbi:MAG: hypothetical protein ABJ275_11350 [Maricaulaceae bacterium]